MASTSKEVREKLLEGQGRACGTSRMGDKGSPRGLEEEVAPIAPCPSCGVGVAQKRVGGSMRRFCCASCRWAWNRQERRRKLMEAVKDAACSSCREAVLEAIGPLPDEDNGGAAP